jgi:hypothetical protein
LKNAGEESASGVKLAWLAERRQGAIEIGDERRVHESIEDRRFRTTR